jgi:hypothetical protein
MRRVSKMSILSDYQEIRKNIGEEKYKQITLFLENNPQYLLSDVYYSEEVWNKMEQWTKENQKC